VNGVLNANRYSKSLICHSVVSMLMCFYCKRFLNLLEMLANKLSSHSSTVINQEPMKKVEFVHLYYLLLLLLAKIEMVKLTRV
jgi:hypothetical protein